MGGGRHWKQDARKTQSDTDQSACCKHDA